MNPSELEILTMLMTRPGECYVHPTENKLYCLIPGGMLIITPANGEDLNTMTEDEINKFIQSHFTD